MNTMKRFGLAALFAIALSSPALTAPVASAPVDPNLQRAQAAMADLGVEQERELEVGQGVGGPRPVEECAEDVQARALRRSQAGSLVGGHQPG